MKSKYENFIGIYDDCFSDHFCDNLINYFNWCQENNKTYKRPDNEIIKKDFSINLEPVNVQEINFNFVSIKNFISEFNDNFWNFCYKEYVENYSLLKTYDQHFIFSYKVQKTVPTGGYHIWHCEDSGLDACRRICTYILYLNDVEEGGETEFLYLSKRISAKKKRLLLFPANYPWAHRGNPPLSGEKYVMTGWLEFK